MREVEFLPTWYTRRRRIQVALVISCCAALGASLAVIVLLALR